MAKRAKGEGTYIHIVPQNCQACPDFRDCDKAYAPGSHCARRDRVERWCYQYYVRDAAGKNRRKALYARSRKELVEKVSRLQKEQDDSTGRTFASVGDWADIWSKKYLPGVVRASTAKFYCGMLRHIPEKLRAMQLTDVSPVDIQSLLLDLAERGGKEGQGLSSSTVRSVRSTLITMFEHAMDNGYVKLNPAKKTKPPRLVRRQIVSLTEAEAARLQKVADTGEYYEDLLHSWEDDGIQYLVTEYGCLIRFALATGVRRGELFGLTWNDVDYTRKRVHIVNNLQKGTLSETKTRNSERYVSLDDDTVKRLRLWQDYQERFGKSVGDVFINRKNLVFTNTFGRHINVDTFRSRHFRKMCSAAALPIGTTLHSLRHTHATLLLQAGVSPKVISERLGHSSVAFTLQTYAHVTGQMERGAADTIGTILNVKNIADKKAVSDKKETEEKK